MTEDTETKLNLSEYEKNFCAIVVTNGRSRRIHLPINFSELLKLKEGEAITCKVLKIRREDGSVRWEDGKDG